MKLICILLLAVVAAVRGWQLSDLARYEWHTFKQQFNKQYQNATEEHQRLKIYLSKRYMIAKHNKRYYRGLESYSLKINHFSDMTSKEYLKISNGFKQSIRTSEEPSMIYIPPANMIPDRFDWREVGAVSRVSDQLNCSSCWAFAATGALEGQLFRKNRNLVPLSVQNLIDCSTLNFGCSGGNVNEAFIYIINNKGIDTDAYYPYEGKNNKCRYNESNSGGYNIYYAIIMKGNEEHLMTTVATIGPVSAIIDASLATFADYSDGVYYDMRCSQDNLNHAVLVVGYGTDKIRGDYWILKNSYGTKWGMDGYMLLARNRDNLCGIATSASFPIAA